MGETRVDLHHLLEDLRDAYAGPVEETILTEVVANALDSGAHHIRLRTDSAASTLVVLDDGSGMSRRDLRRYHDLAASTKTRGQGIGFAGVGIKLGLLVCTHVLTETRRGKTHVASTWHLASRRRAPWRWIDPPGLVATQGTAVRLSLDFPLSPLLDPGFLEYCLRRHFATLLDPTFAELLARHYGTGIRFDINDTPVDPSPMPAPLEQHAAIAIRVARQRRPSMVGYLFKAREPLPEDAHGVTISTFGKVIKRGWDWLGVAPGGAEYLGGLVEAPALSACLTLSKADFIRSGARGATFLIYRKALQEAVSRQLGEWGDDPSSAPHQPKALRIRDIEETIEDLAAEFPLLGTLVERRRGGQRALPLPGPIAVPDLFASSVAQGELEPAGEPEPPPAEDALPDEPPSPTPSAPTPSPPDEPSSLAPHRRRGRYGLEIRFESRPDDEELGRLVDATVWVNEAHPAYRRAVAARSSGYHIALAVALALAPLTAESHSEHEFVTRFLTRWGHALDRPRRRSGRRPKRRQ